MSVEASSWKAMTSAELVRRLRDADVPVPTTTGKTQLIGQATHYLGPTPQDLHTREQTAALVAADGDLRSDAERMEAGWPTAQISPQGEIPSDSVYTRVGRVLAALPAIGKDRNAPTIMGGYAYRGIEDITAALKPLLAANGVVYVPTTLDRIDSVRETANKKALYVVDVHVRFDFYGPDGDSFGGSVWGQGSDSGDKPVSKAYTSALKTFLQEAFCISDSEEDAEAHDVPETVQPPVRVPASKDLVAKVARAVKDAGPGAERWVKDQGFAWPWTSAECESISAKVRQLTLARAMEVSKSSPEATANALEKVAALEASMARSDAAQGVLTDQAIRSAVDVPGGVDGYQDGTDDRYRNAVKVCVECDYPDGEHAEDCPSRVF